MSTSALRMSAVLATAALALAGCRSHARVTPAPVVAPQAAMKSAPEVRVEPPSRDFVTPKPADDLGNDPARATQLADQKGWLRDAFFAFDSSVLSTDAQDNLTDSAKWLRDHRKFNVLIEGHCDERGTEQYNLALGDHRAYEAKEYLVTLGLNSKNISTISYGKDRPFATGHDEQDWAQNRRAHLVLTAPTSQSALR